MSTYTFSDLQWISGADLAGLIRSGSNTYTIIDVRDSDFIGGHIRGCINVPTNTHDYRMPELIRTLRDQDTVIFHCTLSQQRGPSSALRYLRERDRMAEKGEIAGRKDGQDLKTSQKVLVLDGGFSKWQQKYAEDADLTEGYVKDLWE